MHILYKLTTRFMSLYWKKDFSGNGKKKRLLHFRKNLSARGGSPLVQVKGLEPTRYYYH